MVATLDYEELEFIAHAYEVLASQQCMEMHGAFEDCHISVCKSTEGIHVDITDLE